MGTYWDAVGDEFPRNDGETDRAYIAGLMSQLAELNERYRREFSRTEAWHAKWTEQQVILAEAQAKLKEWTGRLEQAREVIEAARALLQRIDHNGGLGAYTGGPAFVVKRLRDALAHFGL